MIYLYIFIMIFLMLVLPSILLLTLKNHKKSLKICAWVLAIIYFALLFVGTTFAISIKNNNLVIKPDFSRKWLSLSFVTHNFEKTNLLINLALLFPIGFLVEVFAKKQKFLKTILFSSLISVFIELYQFILPVPRTTELTDILFNTISGVLSATYCLMLEKIQNKN